MANAVGEDDEPAVDVERLAGPVQLVGELRLKKLAATAAGAVKHHHRVDDPAGRIAARSAERGVVDPKLRESLARGEAEVTQQDVAFLETGGIIDWGGRWSRGLSSRRNRGEEAERKSEKSRQAHLESPVRSRSSRARAVRPDAAAGEE
jgi:hypothetical protein